METIGQWLLQNGRHHPAFFPSAYRKSCIPPNNSTYCSTISILNQHFGQKIMAQDIPRPSIHIGDNNAGCGNIENSFNTIVNYSDEDAKIMHWICPLESNTRYQGLRTDRFGAIGGWLFGTWEWREWRGCEGKANKPILFCCGNPGVGKTYLR